MTTTTDLCAWCEARRARYVNGFEERLCAECAARCCATCSRGLDNEGEHDDCEGRALIDGEEAPATLNPEVRAWWTDASGDTESHVLADVRDAIEMYGRDPDGWALYIESGDEERPQLWVCDVETFRMADALRWALSFLDAAAGDDANTLQGEATDAIESLRITVRGDALEPTFAD